MTLHFTTLENFGQFIKTINGGYHANVANLTIKGDFRPEELQLAQQILNATLQIRN
ncbi:hypothetical protein [Paracnuella aquatica]|uniref:hypothetical protein n=1 Tax=Paracnuella aquatica TaxID=2268757 RepID=UPI0012D76684|nr:hypothetical protein [Paracnuella aquatica]